MLDKGGGEARKGLKIQDPNECPFLRKNVFFIMVDLTSTKNFFYYGKYTVLPKAEIPRVAFRIKNVNRNIKEFSFFFFFFKPFLYSIDHLDRSAW